MTTRQMDEVDRIKKALGEAHGAKGDQDEADRISVRDNPVVVLNTLQSQQDDHNVRISNLEGVVEHLGAIHHDLARRDGEGVISLGGRIDEISEAIDTLHGALDDLRNNVSFKHSSLQSQLGNMLAFLQNQIDHMSKSIRARELEGWNEGATPARPADIRDLMTEDERTHWDDKYAPPERRPVSHDDLSAVIKVMEHHIAFMNGARDRAIMSFVMETNWPIRRILDINYAELGHASVSFPAPPMVHIVRYLMRREGPRNGKLWVVHNSGNDGVSHYPRTEAQVNDCLANWCGMAGVDPSFTVAEVRAAVRGWRVKEDGD